MSTQTPTRAPESIEGLLSDPVAPADGHLTTHRLEQLCVPARRCTPTEEQHLAGCAPCGQRLAAMRDEREALLGALPPQALVSALPRPRQRSRSHTRWIAVGALAAATAAAVALASLQWRGGRAHDDGLGGDGPTLRTKGEISVRAFVRRDQRIWQIEPGVALLPGDAVRLRVYSASGGHLRLLNRTHDMVVKDLLPGGVALTAGEPHTVEGSFVLDAERGREWIVALVSPRPLSSAESAQRVRRLTRGQLSQTMLPVKLPGDVTAISLEITRAAGPTKK